jgi:hypothetical protein
MQVNNSHTFVVNQEFVEATAGGHHGENGNLAVSDDLQESRAIVLNQPLQLLLNLGGLETTVGGNTHSLGKGNKVGVLLVGVRVAILVKEVLPEGSCQPRNLEVLKQNTHH